MIARTWRWIWLLVFFAPLTFLAGRFCWFGPSDPTYHSLVALHEMFPQILFGAAILSLSSVIFRLKRVHAQLGSLRSLASEPPDSLRDAIARAARRLAVRSPEIVYVTASAPLCFTGFGMRRSVLFISRGFLIDLDRAELDLVAQHELEHVRRHDPVWNLVWHLLFAALVIPGFGDLERALRQRRELRANASASALDPDAYRLLLVRCAREHRSLCSDGKRERGPRSGASIALVPVAILSFFVALGIAHADFMRDLPYLTTHHC